MTSGTKARLVLLILGLAAYAPASRTGFLYDDHILIESNPAVRSGVWAGLRQDFLSGIFEHPEGGADFYRPLQVLSTQVEYALWKLNPLPYHLTNLALHIGNVLLLNELLLALGFTTLVSGLAAGLFAVHPIIVEDLLMVSGRGELLGLFFIFGSLILMLRKTRLSVLLGLGAFLLALFSKESAGITPALLAAAFFYKKERGSSYRLLIPMMGLLACYLALRHHALGHLGPALDAPRCVRFLSTAFPAVLLRYARILLLPVDLHTDRLLPPFGPIVFWAMIVVVASGVWVFKKGPRWAQFAYLWYALSFLPKVPLMISGSFMSDHWAYPALPALTLTVAVVLADAWETRGKARRLTARCAAASWLIAGILLTHFNIENRNSDEKLYRSALQYTASPVMKYNLAMTLLRDKRPAEALPYFQSLYANDPHDTNLGRAVAASLWTLGRRSEALSVLDTLLQQFPDDTLSLEMRRQMRQS